MDNRDVFECLFLDVGQGTSNVIYLGDGDAIIIDCGPSYSRQALSFIKRHVTSIKALILSHNDSDHINGAEGILADFNEIIDSIYFLNDGKYDKVWGLLDSYDPNGNINTQRLEAGDDGRGLIYSENDFSVEVIYPGFKNNFVAKDAGSRRANQTSAVIKMSFGEKRIIFAGDATIEAWRFLSKNYFKDQPLKCDVMTIPHHGGKISSGSKELEAQRELYSKIIKPQYGIISVGTSNWFNHPCQEALQALVDSDVEVMCTQMTPQCCQQLEDVRGVNRIIAQPALSSRELQKTGGSKSKNVACVGTITAEISRQEVKIKQCGNHRSNKEQFKKIQSFKPMCD